VSASPATNVDGPSEVRDRIFSSALRHFSQKGYAATSLREVSEDAQTTKPMIYYYFGSKDGLYGSIVREILEEMASVIRHHIPVGGSPVDHAIAYCEGYLQHFLDREEIIALVLREVFGLGGAPMATFAHTLGERVRHPLDDILREGMQSGCFRPDDVFTCATAVTGIMNMFILAHVFGGVPIEREAPIRQVRYYLAGLTMVSEQ
jgi:AcrR family transcriptional regulator